MNSEESMKAREFSGYLDVDKGHGCDDEKEAIVAEDHVRHFFFHFL